jgi:tetratricopeptide (TPR) repeat protein
VPGDRDGLSADRLASIENELGVLSADALALLRGAAVAGEPFDADLATEIAQLAPVQAWSALDELCARDLVRTTATPRRFAFRHPIVRRAVYDASGGGWRLVAHERAAAALSGRGYPLAGIAPHVERSGRVGDRSAVQLLRSAADQAGLRAPMLAARWYLAALAVAGGAAADPALRVPVLSAVSTMLSTVGRFDESREYLTQALAALPSDQLGLRHRLVAEAASLDAFRGQVHGAHRPLLEALHAARPADGEDRTMLLLELAFHHVRAGDAPTAVRYAEEALRTAQALGNRALQGSATASLALAEARAGVASAQAHRRAAEDIFDAASDEQIAAHLDGFCQLAWSSELHGEYRAAARHAERALALSRVAGRAHLFHVLIVVLGVVLLRLGEVDRAATVANDALEAALLTGAPAYLAWAGTVHAHAALERDDLIGALNGAEEAAAQAPAAVPGLACWLTPLVLAETYLATGAPDRARESLLATGPALDCLPANRRPRRLRLLAQSELALGRQPRARAWAEQAREAAAEIGSAETTWEALRARTECDLVGGGDGGTAQRLLGLADALDAAGLVIDAAEARILAGRCLRAARDERSGREVLTAAHSRAVQIGAGRAARTAREAMAGAIGRSAGDCRPSLPGSRIARADAPRARRLRACWPGSDQSGDRGGALPEHPDRGDLRLPHPGQAGLAFPYRTGRAGARAGGSRPPSHRRCDACPVNRVQRRDAHDD